MLYRYYVHAKRKYEAINISLENLFHLCRQEDTQAIFFVMIVGFQLGWNMEGYMFFESLEMKQRS